ncbi:hypothetical protein VIGAN_03272600 [Vigna angularis var. angularis]|uniref:MORF/ORRM1/DAG-like MORF domain-containing protein n=1 Tax=Vigna angularis var. angularis TaxID=157739 RepID=A0A0S3RQ12_PHAAN|nr:hypothetical protein VIGAN_03272600 [Vigna angularis var. angularis]
MASSLIRLRRTLIALSGVTQSVSATHSPSFSAPIRCAVSWNCHSLKGVVQSRSFRSSSTSLLSVRSSQSNIPEEIGPDTILFEGCDYNHWLFVMDFPRDNKPPPEEMVRVYEETCAKGLNIRFLPSCLVPLFLSQCFDYCPRPHSPETGYIVKKYRGGPVTHSIINLNLLITTKS